MPPIDYTKKNLEQACTALLVRCGVKASAVEHIREHTPLPAFLRFTCETAYVEDLEQGVLIGVQNLVRRAARILADKGQFNFEAEDPL